MTSGARGGIDGIEHTIKYNVVSGTMLFSLPPLIDNLIKCVIGHVEQQQNQIRRDHRGRHNALGGTVTFTMLLPFMPFPLASGITKDPTVPVRHKMVEQIWLANYRQPKVRLTSYQQLQKQPQLPCYRIDRILSTTSTVTCAAASGSNDQTGEETMTTEQRSICPFRARSKNVPPPHPGDHPQHHFMVCL